MHFLPAEVYADSSFYDDPEHKYPTIEEQIKMARKVARSLEDANNRAARGHNMYMKRKQKSEKWTAGYGADGAAGACVCGDWRWRGVTSAVQCVRA